MVTCKDKQFELFLSEAKIQERLKAVAAEINKDYADKNPVFLGILNGSFRVAGDLFNYLDIDCEVSFVKLKSYVGTQSSGKLTTMLGLDTDLTGRHVIIVEDIVDTGRTMFRFLPELDKHQPASVNIFTLLTKPEAFEHELDLKYVAFEVPNHFLIGYGLDYDGQGRQHNSIYKIVEE